MGASLCCESVEHYSVHDLRDAADLLDAVGETLDSMSAAGVHSEVDYHLSKLPQTPNNVHERSMIDAAVSRSSLSELCAACEDAGLDGSAITEIEKRFLFESLLSTIRTIFYRPVTLGLLERRLATDASTPSQTQTTSDTWSRVKSKLKIYHAPTKTPATSSCCSGDSLENVDAPAPGPEIAPNVSAIPPALWLKLEKVLQVDSNMSVWPESLKALFLQDIDSIMFDDNESVDPDDPVDASRPSAAAAPLPQDATSPEASPASIIARQLMPCNLVGFTISRCRYCDSVWHSHALYTRHRADCRKNPHGRFRTEPEDAVADVSATSACKHCGAAYAGEELRRDHEAHCLANPQIGEDAQPAARGMFLCDFCSRTFKSRRGCGSHKAYCWNNPRRRGAPTRMSAVTESPCEREPVTPLPTYSCRCGRRFLKPEHCVAHKRQCHIELVAISLRLRGCSPSKAAELRAVPLDHPSPHLTEAERLRAAVVQAVWDPQVFQAWCSVNWGERSRTILCYLLWRNINYSVGNGWVSWSMLRDLLAHFEAPSEFTTTEKWHYVLGMLSEQAPAVEEQWRAWLQRQERQ